MGERDRKKVSLRFSLARRLGLLAKNALESKLAWDVSQFPGSLACKGCFFGKNEGAGNTFVVRPP